LSLAAACVGVSTRLATAVVTLVLIICVLLVERGWG